MTEELRHYVNEELSYMRQLGNEFSNTHPQVAFEDPMVARLMESFAFLTARIRHKMDDGLPEISQTLLNILYPHFQRPIPSMAIVQLCCDPNLSHRQTIPLATKMAIKSSDHQEFCFRTGYNTELYPIQIDDIQLNRWSDARQIKKNGHQPKSCLKISLSCLNREISLAELAPHQLRFYINADRQQAYSLYELLLNQLDYAVISDPSDAKKTQYLAKNCIQSVGFSAMESLLPYPKHSFVGYRLLTEFFAFPEKFLFFDLRHLDTDILNSSNQHLDIYLYFKSHHASLDKHIDKNTLALGCTPIINLFEQPAKSFIFDQTQTEYHVIPGHLPIASTEVYSITSIIFQDQAASYDCYPFYGLKHSNINQTQTLYWHDSRKPSEEVGHCHLNGHETYVSFSGKHPCLQPQNTAAQVHLSLLCCNRDAPTMIPYKDQRHGFYLWQESHAQVSQITCLTPLTPSLRSCNEDKLNWPLISHLSFNHLSLTDNDNCLDTLKSILHLYRFKNNADTHALINGLHSIHCKPTTARLTQGAKVGFAQGTEIQLVIDEKHMIPNESYLLARVLVHFFTLACSINSFIQLNLSSLQRGEIAQWPAHIGKKTAL